MNEASEEFLQDGFSSLIGEKIRFICPGVVYIGKLVCIGSTFITIEKARLIYDTEWKTEPKVPANIYLQISSIQSFWIAP